MQSAAPGLPHWVCRAVVCVRHADALALQWVLEQAGPELGAIEDPEAELVQFCPQARQGGLQSVSLLGLACVLDELPCFKVLYNVARSLHTRAGVHTRASAARGLKFVLVNLLGPGAAAAWPGPGGCVIGPAEVTVQHVMRAGYRDAFSTTTAIAEWIEGGCV